MTYNARGTGDKAKHDLAIAAQCNFVHDISVIRAGFGAFLTQGSRMSEKLGIGSAFPNLTIDLVGGGTLSLPDDLDAKYRVILFYRGHW